MKLCHGPNPFGPPPQPNLDEQVQIVCEEVRRARRELRIAAAWIVAPMALLAGAAWWLS